MKANFITAICLFFGLFFFSSCKKESKEDNTLPPLTAAGLNNGLAGIRVTTVEFFKGSTSFEVNNTGATSATTQPSNGIANMRTIVLEAKEWVNGAPNRRVSISIIIPNTTNTTNGPVTVTPAANAGTPPLAFVDLESYSNF